MNIREFVDSAKARLIPLYGPREAQSIIGLLYGSVLNVPAYFHVTEPEYTIGAADEVFLTESMERLCVGEPLQYVLGKAGFCGLEFKVSPAVLIPRPETEMLCRILIDEVLLPSGRPAPRILDLCTGSGCLAWTLAHYVKGSEVSGVDISEEALKVAASQNVSENIPEFLLCDILDESRDIFHGRMFDVIVSNPPYVRDLEKALMRGNVLDFEPSSALFVPDDDPLVFYRAIARIASGHLAPGGCLAVEINEAFGPEVRDIFISAGFPGAVVRKDLSSRDRFVICG